MTQRNCPQCGAAVELPPERLSDLCAFCATPLVEGEAAAARVDRVAPFVIAKRAAQSRLGQNLQDRWFLPSELKQAGLRPERLKGVLVPFWSVEADARSGWQADQGIVWYRTETYTTVVNGKTVTRTRQVREVEWFPSSGTHVASYSHHLVSGSRGLPEAESNELEPFDLGAARPYDPAFVAGWIAELPTIEREIAQETARQELAGLENAAIRGFLPGDELRNLRSQSEVDIESMQLVLLPVWIATYRHGGQIFRLLVNGQTGEVVGETPIDRRKLALAIGSGLVALMALAAFLLYLADAL